MRQVRDDWVYLSGVMDRNEYLMNVIVVNNIHNQVIEGSRFSIISVLNLGAGYFLILTRRMRVLLSKELLILINSQWFLHDTIVHEITKRNASHSHFSGLRKNISSDYLLSAPLIYEKIEQTSPAYDKNIKSVYAITIHFLLFTPSSVPENQISTTIITLLHQACAYCKVRVSLRHLLCGYLPTENDPMLLRVGIAMSICGAQGKIENEYVFVAVFMIEFAGFTFSSAGTRENEYCVMRQLSYFQPEGNLCNCH